MKPGDVVWLKSGGMPLTVVKINQKGNASVVYWAGEGYVWNTEVPVIALTDINPMSGRPAHYMAEGRGG